MIPRALGLIGKVAAAAVLPRVVKAVCDLVRGADNHRDSARERCTGETSIRNNPVDFIDPNGLETLSDHQRTLRYRAEVAARFELLRAFIDAEDLGYAFNKYYKSRKFGQTGNSRGLLVQGSGYTMETHCKVKEAE